MKKRIIAYTVFACLLLLVLVSCASMPFGSEIGSQICSLKGEHNFELVGFISEPDCEHGGIGLYKCKRCGFESQKDVPALGHDFVLNEEMSKANSSECAEVKIYICSRCGAEEKETKELLGHNYVEDSSKYVAPTCVKSGKKVFICTRCGHEMEEEIKALGHTQNLGDVLIGGALGRFYKEWNYCSRCNLPISILMTSFVVDQKFPMTLSVNTYGIPRNIKIDDFGISVDEENGILNYRCSGENNNGVSSILVNIVDSNGYTVDDFYIYPKSGKFKVEGSKYLSDSFEVLSTMVFHIIIGGK